MVPSPCCRGTTVTMSTVLNHQSWAMMAAGVPVAVAPRHPSQTGQTTMMVVCCERDLCNSALTGLPSSRRRSLAPAPPQEGKGQEGLFFSQPTEVQTDKTS
jgi:hypothetical protein